ncbi:MAG TPA: bifunctional adenosylcobinamide kinase/adenosylcobinamide-phosphate guanylyltransferase [Gemmatimonadaceae bacterium]|nr:bifunctional adenosylcobinamide kinase/adenosylcobinamide-phosphate guanylyltransferase [Gemmatimonadaceae bacterium]
MSSSPAVFTLLIGGVRAGKSRRALALAHERSSGGRVLFVATAQALDDEMSARIDAHRRERPAHWDTLESPIDLADDIGGAAKQVEYPYVVVVVDCLTLWVSNLLLSLPEDVPIEAGVGARAEVLATVLRKCAARGTHVIVVTNEVGLGVVPPTTLGRRYRDALGHVNQTIAGAADEVSLLIAGLELRLKDRPR